MDGTRYESSPTSPQEHQPGRLACQACQRKKIKCDRSMPCGQCLRSNLHCVPSTRKQRARHSGKRTVDTELKNRISKLESLVESLSGEVSQAPDLQEDVQDAPPPPNGPTDPNCPLPVTRKYVASPFWSSLTSEVQALRDALEEDHDGDTPESGPTEQSPPANATALSSLEYDLIVCPPGRMFVMPGAMQDPSPEVARQLYQSYLSNVEPMYKLFHVPTLSMFMLDGAPYLGQPSDSPANQALKRSVWCAALNSLPERDCQAILGQSRADALNHYKRLVGISLAQADMVNTTDMATVQALATYLVASRSSDSTRRVWTLAAILVRIASAMGLQFEDPGRYTPFEVELRRRLWHRIRYIDVFCAVDRGSDFLIKSPCKHVPFPTLCNDEDFNECSTLIPIRTDRAVDTSFSCMTFEACDTTEALMSVDTKPGSDTWEKRHQLALDFGERVRKQYLRYWRTDDLYQRFCLAVAQSMISAMILRAVRPVGKVGPSTPPRVDSPYILEIATENLRASEAVYEDPEGERLRWMIWVQWHALAVALAGLCSIRNTPLAERAWYYVDKHYERSARYVADSRTGMLWKPVEKLYKKASAFRDAGPQRTPFNPAVDPALQSQPIRHASSASSSNGTHGLPTAATTVSSSNTNDDMNWFAASPSFPTLITNLTNTTSPHKTTPATNTAMFGPNSAAFPAETPMFANMDALSTDFGAGMGMGNDTSWLDWEEMMADLDGGGLMNNGDMMGGVGAMQWGNGNDGTW